MSERKLSNIDESGDTFGFTYKTGTVLSQKSGDKFHEVWIKTNDDKELSIQIAVAKNIPLRDSQEITVVYVRNTNKTGKEGGEHIALIANNSTDEYHQVLDREMVHFMGIGTNVKKDYAKGIGGCLVVALIDWEVAMGAAAFITVVAMIYGLELRAKRLEAKALNITDKLIVNIKALNTTQEA